MMVYFAPRFLWCRRPSRLLRLCSVTVSHHLTHCRGPVGHRPAPLFAHRWTHLLYWLATWKLKLALIVAQIYMSVHPSVCLSATACHAYVRSIARREPPRLPACSTKIHVNISCNPFKIDVININI